jgi:hypothetical protein
VYVDLSRGFRQRHVVHGRLQCGLALGLSAPTLPVKYVTYMYVHIVRSVSVYIPTPLPVRFIIMHSAQCVSYREGCLCIDLPSAALSRILNCPRTSEPPTYLSATSERASERFPLRHIPCTWVHIILYTACIIVQEVTGSAGSAPSCRIRPDRVYVCILQCVSHSVHLT